ncbi:major facilitator superfamily domain-containing protein [Radiomyces spectabilis]|uniref:major facilitator superfamily domain-containing protein n=1 Tax=Radiomyces spectabilis TaxID=64574 RepID=UPI00221E3D9C|nr:major facilitator superfamily domain-containing protein [Radiomyces spectabilis]KAI8391613.1 major facilitator superfamily domain-containing protein [Radiomyces spectabilis]
MVPEQTVSPTKQERRDEFSTDAHFLPTTIQNSPDTLNGPRQTINKSTENVTNFHPDDNDDDDDDSDDARPMLQRTSPAVPRNSYIKGPNTTCKIIFLTLCLAGLQFTWSVEMAYGTPYLLSLGLSKAYMSLVWIAGPLSGLLMQPIVGALSDRCTSRLGRRRPFLLGGSVVVVLSLLMIGWTRELTSLFTGTQEGSLSTKVSIGIAIAAIYILDFSVNCVQASCRALIVDALPQGQQEDGTAWAGRMVGLGNVAGYFTGYADLVAVFPFFGNTQLKVLCVVASIVLLLCDAITCYTVKEKVLTKDTWATRKQSPFKALSAIFVNIWHLPKPIQRICNVQFFAWIGWFPFLFYSTTWVAEIYDQTALQNGGGDEADAVGQATRAGSFAFLVYSIVSLSASFLLPLFITSSSSSSSSSFSRDDPDTNFSSTIKFTFRGRKYSFAPSQFLHIPFLTLPRAWTISHLIFCLAMLSTALVSSVAAASVVIGICGISWAITMWAPFSLLGEYIASVEAQRHEGDPTDQDGDETRDRLGMNPHFASSRISLAAGAAGIGTDGGIYQLVEHTDPRTHESADHSIPMDTLHSEPAVLPHTTEDSPDQTALLPPQSRYSPDTELQQSQSMSPDSLPSTGVLLGIHNMYIVLPQFLVTFASSIIFHFLEKDIPAGDESSTNAIGVVLRFGAIMAGVAGYFCTKITRSQ